MLFSKRLSTFLIIFLIIGKPLFSQIPVKNQTKDSLKKQHIEGDINALEKRALKFAMHYNDYPSAITIMYSIIAKEQKNTIWRDSLCVLYFLNKAYPQCITASNELLAGNVNNEKIAVLQAISYKNIGNLKEALNIYDKLYVKYKNPYYLYEVAQLQYFLKRNAEFSVSVNTLFKLTDDQLKDKILSIASNNEEQKVPLKAAVYNLNGIMLKESENKEDAIKAFEEALKLFPDFKLAKANLEDVKKKK